MENIKKKLRRLHEDLVDSLYLQTTKDIIKTKTFFAGGCVRDLIRNKQPKDYDLFFFSEEDRDLFVKEAHNNFALKKTAINNYNIQVGDCKVQIITVVCGMPDNLVKTFDFTINQGFYVPQLDILKHGDAGSDLLVCDNIQSPLNALVRTIKFVNDGYNITSETMIRLGVAVSKMQPITTEDQLIEALKGISTGNERLIKSDSEFKSDDIPF